MTAALSILDEIRIAGTTALGEKRGILLRHVTDLFVVGSDNFSDHELALFDSVFNCLVVEIETSARALLAIRLAPIPSAPPGIIRVLAFDDDADVACPVLAQSEQLDDQILVANAETKGQDHLLAISRRRTLSEAVTDVLVERGDAQVVVSAAENAGARFSDIGFTRLVERSASDDRLALRVGKRADIPLHLFTKLLAHAGAHVRTLLEAEYPRARYEVGRAVDEVVGVIEASDGTALLDSSPVRKSLERMHRSGQLDDEQIRSFAEDGLLEQVKVSLSILSQLPLQFVEKALRQESGEILLVLARANGMSWATVKSIMQLPADRRPSTSGEIRNCLTRFEKLGRATASQIMRFYRDQPTTSKHPS